MSTPRKNFNYNSPYAKPVQQYPSQSQDYISLDMGGPGKPNNNSNADNYSNSNEKAAPGRYNGKFYQQNSNYRGNRRNYGNNNYNQHNNRQPYNPQQQHHHHQQRFQQRNSNERPHFQQKQNHHQVKANTQPIEAYCHPSMTEDPWFDLMERLQSLEKSKITVRDITPPKDTTPPPDSHSSTASDDEDVISNASD